jgi:hypothetical protein
MAIFRVLGFSLDVQTLDKQNCAKRQLSILADFGGLNVTSLELDAKDTHCASFTATLANPITCHDPETLGPMYGLI